MWPLRYDPKGLGLVETYCALANLERTPREMPTEDDPRDAWDLHHQFTVARLAREQ